MTNSVGKSVPRIDAFDKVTGHVKYTADMEFEGMLYAGLVRSPVRHALLHDIDSEIALSQPGIVAVITAKDIPGKLEYGAPYEDHPILAYDRLRFIGEPCAIVIAETRGQLLRAIPMVSLEYEELPIVDSLHEAMQDNSCLVHESGNLIERHIVEHGDINTGFEEADHIVTGTYTVDWQEHAALEPDVVIAYVDDQGLLTVIAPSQNPFSVRSVVAQTINLAPETVRIIQPEIGGSFGGKNDFIYQLSAQAALATWILHRPIELLLSREESILTGNKRHAMELHHRTGVASDGRICAWEMQMLADGGAYAATSPFVIWRGVAHGCGPYEVPNAKVIGEVYYTNSVPAASMRGFGAVQAIFAAERQMDKIAKVIEIDPVELRRKNMLRSGSTVITGDTLKQSVGLEQTFDRVLELSEYSSWKDKSNPPRSAYSKLVRGRGIALAYCGVSLGAGEGRDYADAKISLCDEGIITCDTGLTDMGTGVLTAYTQIISDALSVPTDKIHVRRVDTVLSPESNKTVASRSTYVGGMAVYLAAQELKKNIINLVKGFSDLSGSKIDLVDGCIIEEDKPQVKLFELEKIASKSRELGEELSSHVHYELPPLEWNSELGQGEAYYSYGYSAQVAEVTVDMATGKVNLDRLSVVVDCGKAINPDAVLGQIYGGAAMGVGYALLEEVGMENGRLSNLNFDRYLLPTAADIGELRADIVEALEPSGPFGAKGIAELVTVGVAPAVVNAVCNAIGEERDDIPLNLERTLLGHSLKKS